MNRVKEINIKNCTYYFFDMINIKILIKVKCYVAMYKLIMQILCTLLLLIQ